jgi:16S rRNA (cytidine1402-2'-O)-methyltransferase
MDHITKKERGWLLPDSIKSRIVPGLYLISTPIGNLADITLRALDTLDAADIVICEDTRVSGKLLNYYGLKKTLMPYHDHNAAQQRPAIIDALRGGSVVALISDAGTPLISDPGFKLVQDCAQAGIYVTAVPGANAPLPALQLSTFASDQFCFLGFLPAKQGPRKALLSEWKHVPASLIAFETGPRLEKALKDIADLYGERPVAVVREITKMYEEVRRGPAQQLHDEYAKAGAPKGEIVLVIAPPLEAAMDDQTIEDHIRKALETMKTKDAALHVADLSGRPRAEIYDLVLKVHNGKKPE